MSEVPTAEFAHYPTLDKYLEERGGSLAVYRVRGESFAVLAYSFDGVLTARVEHRKPTSAEALSAIEKQLADQEL